MQKGQKYLLEAVSKIKTSYPQIMLLMVGDGPLRGELEDYVKTLNIQENILFLGTRRDIPELLAAMDIFVLPSVWEGLCNSLIEAMAASKPIIATDISPIREIVNSERFGILVPTKSSGAIAASIELLLENKPLVDMLGKAAMGRAFSSFNLETTVNAYTTLFDNILTLKGYQSSSCCQE